jgi:di/tricarboxylate transporter
LRRANIVGLATIRSWPGGYRFGDYWWLGLPLSLIVLAVGRPLIAFFWPT